MGTTEEQGESHAIQSRLTAALERAPRVEVPEEFAMRVMQRLPESQVPRQASRVGRTVGYASAGGIALTLLLLVGGNPMAFTAGRGFAFVFEMMLMGELLAVGFWLGTRRGG